jgi:hypothetical protein
MVRVRTRAIWRRAAWSALTAIVLILTQRYIEHTDAGEQLKIATYGWLQHRLRSEATPPIVVVDISAIRPTPIPGAQKDEEATPRTPLLELLSRLAMHGPRAIGVDIDFSPDLDGRVPITSGDGKFFEDCLELERDTKVPIYLGVARTISLPPERWLWRERYQDLAASILAPRAHLEMMVACLKRNGGACGNDSMAARLAARINASNVERCFAGELWWFRWLDCDTGHQLTNGLYAGLFPVDYSQLRALKSETRTAAHVALDDGEFVRGKVVLLGDTSLDQGADTFVVPGEGEPIAGVYVNASAAYTLAMAPLSTFHWPSLIDAALALLLIAILIAVQWAYRDLPREPSEERIQGALIAVFVGLVVAFAAVVQIHRIMWPDFTMVIFGLLMHPKVERWARTLLNWLRDRTPDIRAYFFAKEG